MNSVNVHTHHRMGDHLICYGGIKEIAKRYDEVVVRAFSIYLDNIRRLYLSIPNVKVIPVENSFWDNSGLLFCSTDWWFEQVKQWYDYKNRPNISEYNLGESMIFDRFWYHIAGLPFNLKWDNFYLNRDMDAEKNAFYNILGLRDGEHYVFLHEDPSNTDENRKIDRRYIDSDVKLINIERHPNISILDTTYLIERALEIHVINSSFLTFIDLMQIKHKVMVYHRYTRPNPVEQVALRSNWQIIE